MTIAEKLTMIAENEQKVFDAGYEKGASEVGGGGYDEGFEAGKQAEYDRFWDAFQENGNRTTYTNAFTGWYDSYYQPKYPITITSAATASATYNSTKITNTKVSITVNCQTITTLFANATSLVTIPHLDLTNVTKLIDRCFNSCTNLTNVTMVGTINANGFDVSPCKKLTHDSLMSIINALANKKNDTSGTQWVCTLGTDNLNKLTNEEKAIATGKGWGLA